MFKRYDLRDRVVLITGASSGIGRACAAAFVGAGARVAAAARSSDRLASLAEELGRDRLLPVVMDVTAEADRARGVGEIESAMGPVDVLINNAGWASFGTVLKMPGDHVSTMVELNLVAPVALIQMLVPGMLERGQGQVINISSVVGTQPIPRMSFYSATKAALNGLSTGLRMELKGSPVDVIVVAPGSTNTAFFSSAATVDAKATRIASTQYTPERVAAAVVASSRRRRSYVTLTAEGKAICAIRRVSSRVADMIMHRVAKKGMPMVESA